MKNKEIIFKLIRNNIYKRIREEVFNETNSINFSLTNTFAEDEDNSSDGEVAKKLKQKTGLLISQVMYARKGDKVVPRYMTIMSLVEIAKSLGVDLVIYEDYKRGNRNKKTVMGNIQEAALLLASQGIEMADFGRSSSYLYHMKRVNKDTFSPFRKRGKAITLNLRTDNIAKLLVAAIKKALGENIDYNDIQNYIYIYNEDSIKKTLKVLNEFRGEPEEKEGNKQYYNQSETDEDEGFSIPYGDEGETMYFAEDDDKKRLAFLLANELDDDILNRIKEEGDNFFNEVINAWNEIIEETILSDKKINYFDRERYIKNVVKEKYKPLISSGHKSVLVVSSGGINSYGDLLPVATAIEEGTNLNMLLTVGSRNLFDKKMWEAKTIKDGGLIEGYEKEIETSAKKLAANEEYNKIIKEEALRLSISKESDINEIALSVAKLFFIDRIVYGNNKIKAPKIYINYTDNVAKSLAMPTAKKMPIDSEKLKLLIDVSKKIKDNNLEYEDIREDSGEGLSFEEYISWQEIDDKDTFWEIYEEITMLFYKASPEQMPFSTTKLYSYFRDFLPGKEGNAFKQAGDREKFDKYIPNIYEGIIDGNIKDVISIFKEIRDGISQKFLKKE